MSERPLLLIVDMSALAFRSHFAMFKNPLTRSDGMATSALFGMCQSLISVVFEFKPQYVLCALDSKEATFRHEMYPEYKAHRPECPPELIPQLIMQEELCEAFGFAVARHPGFEADDIIAAYTVMGKNMNLDVLIYSGDKDFMQLLDAHTRMLVSHRGGDSEILPVEGVKEKMGVESHQIADFLALVGDKADNIPGAPGVGKVTAAQLLEEYGDLPNILAQAHKITKKSLAAKLQDHRELILLSRRLVELCIDIPSLIPAENLKFEGFDKAKVVPFLKKMEFPKILSKLDGRMEERVVTESLAESTGKVLQIKRSAKLEELIQLIHAQSKESMGLYIETKGLDILGVAVSFTGHPTLCYRSEAFLEADWSAFFQAISKVSCCCIEAKNVVVLAQHYAPKVVLDTDDILLMESVLFQGSKDQNLEALVERELKAVLPELGKVGNKKRSLEDLSDEEFRHFLGERSHVLLLLKSALLLQLKARDLNEVYEKLEKPLMRVIGIMESSGVALNSEPLMHQSEAFSKELDSISQQVYELSGETFNIQSPQQLGVVLFDKMKLQEALGLKKIKKTKTGYSTDSSVLESLRPHPMADLLLRYRFLSKLKSTYLDALPKEVHPQTRRIHTTYQQNGTATGRLSSLHPNLQNIPMRVPEGAKIREAFVPQDRAHVLISADYSQIELRVLAYYCQDEVMLEAFRSDSDIHRATAAKVFKVPLAEVTKEQRSNAKAVNFGLLYGMGPKLLSQQTGLSFAEAQKFIKAYFETFPSIREFMTQQVEKARSQGYVLTLSGRRRDLPDLNHDNGMLRSAAENMALNTPIQGSAADIIKWAMLRLQNRIERENLPLRMLLQVHDELVFETPKNDVEPMIRMIKEEMESKVDLPKDFEVPLTVEVGYGEHWLAAH
jgi:DNA polymerase I